MVAPQIQAANVVLLGPFNPAIFHPSWLASYNLIRRQEAEAAEIQIIHPNVAAFTVEWLQIKVTEDQFQASTTLEAYYETLRDLVIGILEVLSRPPIAHMGINREFHYLSPSVDVWHSIGYRLAPKQDWEGVLEQPKMRSLTMQGVRPDPFKGYIQTKVEPSPRVEPGIFVQINDHYELGTSSNESLTGSDRVIQILSEQWSESMQRSLSIAEKVASLGDIR
jgi:hypothetical protein